MDRWLNKIICGDCREILRQMPENSIHTVVTSPPYWSLRDYGIEPTVWDGDPDCQHEWIDTNVKTIGKGGNWQQADNGPSLQSGEHYTRFKGNTTKAGEQTYKDIKSGFCRKCGAWLGCLGLEPTPELYINHLVDVLEKVKRILRPDGQIWVNIGDNCWGGKGKSGYELPHEVEQRRKTSQTIQRGHNVPGYMNMRPSDSKHPILKPKDLCLIPQRLAIALQEAGWRN